MKYTILVTAPEVTPAARDILSSLGSVTTCAPERSAIEQQIASADIIFAGLGVNFTKDLLSQGTQLKVIATATTGLDHIDLAYAKERGIEVLSLKGEEEFLNTITGTAELACALMLDLLRLIPHAFDSVKRGEWDRERFRGHNVSGHVLGIVGLGRLGRMMARYGEALDMKVIAYDPKLDAVEFNKRHATSVSFDELLNQSDVISIHVHLSAETENMFDAGVFEKMKPTAHLINTARGKIVNEADLLKALENKTIAGYATDVLADETQFGKTFENNPLVEYSKSHTNLIITPHIGGMTYESREATDIFMAEKVRKYFQK